MPNIRFAVHCIQPRSFADSGTIVRKLPPYWQVPGMIIRNDVQAYFQESGYISANRHGRVTTWAWHEDGWTRDGGEGAVEGGNFGAKVMRVNLTLEPS